MNPSRLYHLDASHSPEHAARVRRAVDWLIEQEVGGTLMDNAYRRNDRHTLGIVLGKGTEHGGGNNIHIDLDDLPKFAFTSDEGKLTVPSLESVIAHELVHAGQPEGYQYFIDAAKQARQPIREEKERRLAAGASLFAAVSHAEDYEHAHAAAEVYVDKVTLPLAHWIVQRLEEIPEHQAYLGTVEAPAIEAENRVAALQGKGQRQHHDTYANLSPEHLRATLVDEALKKADAYRKPGAPAHSWQQRVIMGERPASSEHPRVSSRTGRPPSPH